LKVIDQQGKLQTVKITDIGKKIPKPRERSSINARDKKGNNLAID